MLHRMAEKDASKSEQQEWVRAVLAHTGLNLAQLAKKIGRAPSTLQRPMNDPAWQGMLSGRVMAEIAEIAGLRVMEFPGRPKGFMENEAEPFRTGHDDDLDRAVAKAIGELTGGRNGCEPWFIHTSLLDLHGILPGDVMIVDLNRRAKPGDIVCAQIYDYAAGRAETAFRLYDPPFLLSHSARRSTKPLTVDDDTVKVMGVVISLVRQFGKSNNHPAAA